MDPHPAVGPRDQSVQDFVCQDVLHGRRAVLVEDAGRLIGIVTATDAKQVPQEAWADTPIGTIMTPMPLTTIAPDADASEALQLLVDGSHNQLPVIADGRAVGMLSRSDLLRFIRLRHELGIGGRSPDGLGRRVDRRSDRPAPTA
jgi:CBS domain-containing protein